MARTIRANANRLGNVPMTVKIVSFRFVKNDVKSMMNRGVAHLTRCTAGGLLPLVLIYTSKKTHVRRKDLDLVRVTGVSSILCSCRSGGGLFCITILASPAANKIATDFNVLKSVVVTRPGTCVTFTNGEMVRRALGGAMPRSSRITRCLFRGNLFSPVMPHGPLGSILDRLFQLRTFFPLSRA